MADDIEIKLEGIDELNRRLAELPEKLRGRAVQNAMNAGARVIRDEAKANAPILKAPVKNRKAGTLKSAISVRRSKNAAKAGDVGAFVGVRPLRGARTKKLGKAGAENPNDPYYWRFVEFGTKAHVIKPKKAGFLNLKGKKRLSFIGKSGKLVRPKSVNHPGTDAVKFLTNAANSKDEQAIKKFMDVAIPQIEKLNK